MRLTTGTTGTRILGLGAYQPARVVTNHDLAATPFVLFPRTHNPGFYDRILAAFASAGVLAGYGAATLNSSLAACLCLPPPPTPPPIFMLSGFAS